MYFIYPGSVNYTFLFQRPQQLMRCFGELGFDGIYINGPAVLEGSTHFEKPTVVSKGLTVVPENHRIEEYAGTKNIFYCTYPLYMYHWKKINPKLKIFDSIDEPVGAFAHWNVANLHDKSIKEADLVLASAQKLYDSAKEINEEVLLIPNGCDFEHFKRPQKEPENLKNIPRPRITFTGALASWLDKDLIKKIALEFPDSSVVLVGPIYDGEFKNFPKNVHFLGHQPYDTMPGYLHNSEVLIIPFDVENPVIEATNPIKLWEYLATGKNIVTTDIREINFRSVWKAKTHEEFLEGIAKGIELPRSKYKKERILIAKENSWMQRAKTVTNRIYELL